MPRQIQTEIDINASATIVWKRLIDLPRHAEWNPFLTQISGTIAEGERLSVTIAPPGATPATLKPKIVKVVEEQELRWVGRMGLPGMFEGQHVFQIEPAPGAKTRFIHSETFSGLLVPFQWQKIEGPTRAGFEAMNEALKRVAEEAAGNL